MIERILRFSLANKFIVLLFSLVILLAGLFSLSSISVGAVPDVTNNQVQIITTSRSLSTEDVEKFLTLPVELEIANLPGVLEIRSISKFGLSVVTVVFEESMGTYLPRQLITERLDAIKARIPEGFGSQDELAASTENALALPEPAENTGTEDMNERLEAI